jgi:hypothetical protein
MDLSELQDEDAAQAAGALTTLADLPVSTQIPVAEHQPRYQLTISDGPIDRTIVLYETQIPTELRPLLEVLRAKAMRAD